MNTPRSLCLPAVLLLAATLGACGQTPATNDTASAPPADSSLAVHAADATPVIASASAPVIASASASAHDGTLPGDHASSKRYRIAIELPVLPAGATPLANALRATADNAKRDFMQALPDPSQLPELANRQFELQIHFSIAANTPAFTSVRETGGEDTGGAHPIPIEAAFVFDNKAGKVITLDELFSDPDAARKALANFTHDTLLKKFMASAPKPGDGSSPEAIADWKANMVQMLDDGTRPTSVNYSMFVVRAGATPDAPSPGLALVFPPYQVAPYVYGTQTVDVPASVFAKFLKPGNAAAFVH